MCSVWYTCSGTPLNWTLYTATDYLQATVHHNTRSAKLFISLLFHCTVSSRQVLVLAYIYNSVFETSYVDVSQTSKYEYLLETCTANGYTTSLIMLEVGEI